MNSTLEVTRLSSKGQIVLPQAIRDKLHLDAGMKFVVIGEGDTVILKKIEMPSHYLEQAKELVKKSRAYAKKVGLKRSDIDAAIRYVRSHPK